MTNREHNELEKLLKDNLSDKAALVPEFVWDRIEEELFPKKKRRGFFWLFFGGIGLIGCMVAAYFIFGNVKQASNQTHLTQQENTVISNGKKQAPAVKSNYKWKNGSAEKINVGEEKPTFSSGNGSGNSSGSLQSNGKTEVRKNSSFSKGDTKNGSTKISGTSEGNKSGFNNDNPISNLKKLPLDSKNTELVQGENPEDKASNNPVVEKIPFEDSSFVDKSQVQKEQSENNSDSTLAEIISNDENADTLKPVEKTKRFAISIHGGTSLYDMGVFKDYFTSGQLSNRSFKSSGFEFGAGFSFKVSRKIGIYTNVAFNQKHTSFDYNLAITESDYFDHILNGELLQIEDIIDNGVGNCFLTNVSAYYKVNYLLFSLGSTFEILRMKKFSIGSDIRFSSNLSSKLQMQELSIFEIPKTEPERFNTLKIGIGLNLDYHLNNNFSLGITPMYHVQFHGKQSFYSKRLKELVLPLRINFYF